MKTIDLRSYSEANKKEIETVVQNLNDQLASIMVYEKVGRNEVLFRAGERGTKFYIIMKGIVRIL